MPMLTGKELSEALSVSKARVSQLTAAGDLDGCWQGKGRARRYDLGKVADRLGKTMDRGQALGNGAATAANVKRILADPNNPDEEEAGAARDAPKESAPLSPSDPDRYELARIEKAEQEARRLRRLNGEAEGKFVLASEVRVGVARMIAQEIAEFESVLRDGARAIADELGVDFKAARKILVDRFREHRGKRSAALEQEAASIGFSDDEAQEDF